MGLFGRPRFLDRYTEDWLFDTWAWLTRNLGGASQLKQTPLVTPSREFFPKTAAEGHDRAAYAFDIVKRAMGMDSWDCELIAADRPPPSAQVGEFWTLQSPGSVAGTFSVKDGAVAITYASDLLGDPAQLVTTFAHELAHYLLATVKEDPPGGHDLHELATDLAVAHAGFGIFGINGAFHFQQFTDSGRQGWSSKRSGYLSERTWALALAVFLASTDRVGAAEKWLKPSVKSLVRDAERYLVKHPQRLEGLAEPG